MEDTEQATADEEQASAEPAVEAPAEATKPAGEIEAYESEWYEVLKRRAEELEEEGDEADDAV